jgi:hypothetical protein
MDSNKRAAQEMILRGTFVCERKKTTHRACVAN